MANRPMTRYVSTVINIFSGKNLAHQKDFPSAARRKNTRKFSHLPFLAKFRRCANIYIYDYIYRRYMRRSGGCGTRDRPKLSIYCEKNEFNPSNPIAQEELCVSNTLAWPRCWLP